MVPEGLREWNAAPIWFVPQKQDDDCGGATLLTLAAFHLARVGKRSVAGGRSPGRAYAPVTGRAGAEAPQFPEEPPAILEGKLKPNNLVKSPSWACDPMGLWVGLRESVKEFGYPDPNWALLAVPVDPGYPGAGGMLGCEGNRGAEETVLARVAWQLANLGEPVALGLRVGSNLHWVTVFGVSGEVIGEGHLVAHSLSVVDPLYGDYPLPLDRNKPICARHDGDDYWQNQLVAVCSHARAPGADEPAELVDVPFSRVDLLPIARANTTVVRDPRALPISPSGEGPYEGLRFLYQRGTWKDWIANHARHNAMVDRDLARPLGRGEVQMGPPLPVWGERSETYSFLLPLLAPGDEPRWQRLTRVVEMDQVGLVSRILPPTVFHELFRRTPLLDPSEPALGWQIPGPVASATPGSSLWTPPAITPAAKSAHRLVWPRERPTSGRAVPVIQALERPPGVGCLDLLGHPVTFKAEIWG